MKPTTLFRISFGAASTLTRDGMGVTYTELKIADSEWPPAG